MSTMLSPPLVYRWGKPRYREVKWFAKVARDFRAHALSIYTVFEKLGIDSTCNWRNPNSEIMTQGKMASCPDLLSGSCSFDIQLPCLPWHWQTAVSLCYYLTFLPGLYSHKSSIMKHEPPTQDHCLGALLDASPSPLLDSPRSPEAPATRSTSVFLRTLSSGWRISWFSWN